MSSKSGKTTTTTTSSITQKRERIFSELADLIPLEGENAINQQGTKTFYSHNSSPKLSVPLDDETFEIMAEELTCPSPRGDGNDYDSDTPMNEDVIKRSYRIMTYMVQDMQEAQNFLVNKFGDQDKYSDILYIRNLINPTRAGLLAKRLFSAYRQLVAFYQAAVDTHFHNVQRSATDKEENKGLKDESFIVAGAAIEKSPSAPPSSSQPNHESTFTGFSITGYRSLFQRRRKRVRTVVGTHAAVAIPFGSDMEQV
jgi:hypothetical protein